MPLFLRIATLFFAAEGLRTREQVASTSEAVEGGAVNEAYTFEEFVQDFARKYDAGSEEYARRAAVFQESLVQIHAQNSRANQSWTAGVYPFMDWTGAERAARLHGYKPSSFRRSAPVAPAPVALQVGSGQRYGGAGDSFLAAAPPVRNQGACGSCWAVAAVEAVEAQLMKVGSPWNKRLGDPQLSPQAVLDCVRNPKHCGGNGGCEGATPQLAFDYMQSNGLPLEADIPYRPADTGSCPLEPYPLDTMRVSLSGWHDLPTNQAQPLMRALVEEGPAVVAVHAHQWDNYRSGVFDGCVKDAIPAHSVLLKGYGVADLSSGKEVSLRKYWLIQNSWGPGWGEEGSIRLLRRDDDDHWCGTDTEPHKGSACDDDLRQEITVCGSCGLLYDATIPQVGRVRVTKAGDEQEARDVSARLSKLDASVSLFRSEGAQPSSDAEPASSADPSASDSTSSPLGWRSDAEASAAADPDVRAADALDADANKDTDVQDAAEVDPREGQGWPDMHASEATGAIDAPVHPADPPVGASASARHAAGGWAAEATAEVLPTRAEGSQASTARRQQKQAGDNVLSAFSAADSTFARWRKLEGESGRDKRDESDEDGEDLKLGIRPFKRDRPLER